MLILLFPLTAFSILRGMVEARFDFRRVATGTIVIAVHLAIILGYYKLKALIFRDSMRCSACGRDIQMTGRQRCRGCGFRWQGHYFDKCPNCGTVASIIHCPHCEMSSRRPWWFDRWHRLN